MTKQSKSIGLIKSNFSDNKIKIYEAYRGLKKIRDFKSNDDLKPLIDLVGKWRYYIGIKEELSQEELFMNLNFIRENFSELNLVDINQAIDLSIKGDLDVEVEHYQSFTPLYISRILKSYKEYRNKVIFAIREKSIFPPAAPRTILFGGSTSFFFRIISKLALIRMYVSFF